MGNWTRVKKAHELKGKAPRTKTAIRKNRGSNGRPYFIAPKALTGGEMSADVYRDGPTRFAFDFNKNGEFAAGPANGSKALQAVTLPMEVSDLVPFGTTDIPYTTEGDLIVIDLAELAPAVAAE